MSLRRAVGFLKPFLSIWVLHGKGARRFLQNEGGSVAIYFGLSALVFVGVAGLAVDAARGYLIKARLSEAIDAAALAGGKSLEVNGAGSPKINADVLAFFHANFPQGAMGANVQEPTISVINNNSAVQVSSTAVIPTTLMSVLGFKNMTMAAGATVTRAAQGLDVVFSFDISGSMCQPCSKIDSLKDNASKLVDSLANPFTSGGQNQIVTLNGNTYSLLNIGVVPWSSKVNVRTYNPATRSTPTGTGTVTSTTINVADPMGRFTTLTKVYKSTLSEAPLLYDPRSMAGGSWTGCVFARYTERTTTTRARDDDITLGATPTWPGWEPMSTDETEPQSARNDNCDASYWNNNVKAGDGSAIPGGWPNPPSPKHSEECAQCPTIGILPLQTNITYVKNMISDLNAGGATDAPQGLFWAWEVLMPGAPFDQAVVAPPFQRTQAILFMTDGQNFGSNGDAYHGWFGYSENAATVSGKGTFSTANPSGSGTLIYTNNLNSRLLALAAKIKGKTPTDPAAVKIYVIQYEDDNSDLTTLLKAVATNATDYYFFAPDPASLNAIFTKIAANLSALRLSK